MLPEEFKRARSRYSGVSPAATIKSGIADIRHREEPLRNSERVPTESPPTISAAITFSPAGEDNQRQQGRFAAPRKKGNREKDVARQSHR